MSRLGIAPCDNPENVQRVFGEAVVRMIVKTVRQMAQTNCLGSPLMPPLQAVLCQEASAPQSPC